MKKSKYMKWKMMYLGCVNYNHAALREVLYSTVIQQCIPATPLQNGWKFHFRDWDKHCTGTHSRGMPGLGDSFAATESSLLPPSWIWLDTPDLDWFSWMAISKRSEQTVENGFECSNLRLSKKCIRNTTSGQIVAKSLLQVHQKGDFSKVMSVSKKNGRTTVEHTP